MKKIPQRRCVVCNTQKDKKDLIRVVKDKDGNIDVDKTGKANGRGTYICSSIDCLDKSIKSKKLERVLESNNLKEVYEKVRGVIIDK